MKRSFLLSALLFSLAINAQIGSVGVNTDNPQATLDVVGNPTNSSKLDGIIAPRLTGEELAQKNYTSSQIGAIVYVTEVPFTPSDQGIRITEPGYYFFNGSSWQPFLHNRMMIAFSEDGTMDNGWYVPLEVKTLIFSTEEFSIESDEENAATLVKVANPVPDVPTTGRYSLKSINGVMTWVAE